MWVKVLKIVQLGFLIYVQISAWRFQWTVASVVFKFQLNQDRSFNVLVHHFTTSEYPGHHKVCGQSWKSNWNLSLLFREGLLLGNAKLGTFLIFFILAIQTPLFYFFTLFPSLGPLCFSGYVDDFSALAICFSGWSCLLILDVETCLVRDNVTV